MFIIGGIINGIINIPFIKSLGKDSKEFLIRQIKSSGGKQNILNIIEGYRESLSILEDLSNRNDWTRKIEIFDD